MPLNDRIFFFGQPGRFIDNGIRNSDHTDIMHISSIAQIVDSLVIPAECTCDQCRIICHSLGMSICIYILCLDGYRKRLDRLQRNALCLSPSALKLLFLAEPFQITHTANGSDEIEEKQDNQSCSDKKPGDCHYKINRYHLDQSGHQCDHHSDQCQMIVSRSAVKHISYKCDKDCHKGHRQYHM